MATSYGGWGKFSGYSTDAFRVVMDYSISSQNDTSATIKLVVKCQMGYAKDAGYNFSATANISGTTKSATGSAYQDMNGTYTIISSHTKSITKTTSAQSISVSASVSDTYMGGSSSTSASISVPAKPSYSVTYNANGGSGAPSTGTKWYGQTDFKISTTVPTRTNYKFLRWNTKADGTGTNYASGASYTGNAALALYAVWELAFVAPTISSLTAYRSDSAGNSDPTNTEYMTFKCVWSFNQTGGTNNSGSVVFSYAGTSTTVTISGATSGTAERTVNGTFTDAYQITALLTDKNNLTATKSVRVSTVWKPFTMRKTGTDAGSAAFFGLADTVAANMLKIFGRLWIEGRQETWVSGVQGNAAINFYKKVLNANSWNPSLMFQTKGGGAWEVGNHDGEELRFVYFAADRIANSTNTANATITFNSNGTLSTLKTWTKIYEFKSGTSKTISIPSACTELLICARCTSTVSVDGSTVRRYSGSVFIPRALVDTTQTEWLLGGGSVGSTSSASGTRYCAIRLSTTKALGVGAHCDGTDYASTTTFYIYWR